MIKDIEKQLGSADVDLRRDAVLRLRGVPGDGPESEEAVRLLARAMQDPSWRVRKTAVDVLYAGFAEETYMKRLLNLLQMEDNAGARSSAVEVFVKLGKKATGSLMEAFGSPNADLRKFILDILGRINDRRALPLLVRAIRDEDENVRAAAVEQLGAMGEHSVVEPLMDILKGGDLWTSYPAADALGRIGDGRAVPALVEALENKTLREPALRALGMIADGSCVDKVASFIEDKSRAVQHEALTALESLYHKGVSEEAVAGALRGRFGDRAMEVLFEHAKSNRPEVRASAILLLGLLKDERSLRPLLELSGDEEFTDDVRRALVFIGRAKPESLLPLFRTEDPYLKRFVCDVAAEVASPTYVSVLEGFLGDDDGHVRASAAIGLAKMGGVGSIGKIRRLLQDPFIDVQEAALRALGGLKEGLDVNEILEHINSKDPILRRNMVLLLGEMGRARAVPTLGERLKDEEVSVRRAVVKALSKIRTPEAFRAVSQALTDEDMEVRVSAVLSLGMTGDESHVEDLVLLLNDSEDMVKVSAAKALGSLGSGLAAPALIRLLSDGNGFVVTAAIDALGRLGGDDAREALKSMLSSPDREIRRSAITALARFSGVDEQILPFVRDRDWAMRVAAVESLAGRRSERVRAEIEKVYDEEEDPVVRGAMEKYLNA